MKIIELLSGKKSYVIGGGIILGALFLLLTQYTFENVPEAVWLILNGLGFGAIRAGINSVSPNDNQGWKTYAAALILTGLGAAKLGGVELPADIFASIIAASEGLGVVGIRNALNKIE